MIKFKWFAVFTLFIFFSSSAQTIITDRPDQTESSSTVKWGSLQIESGILLEFSEDEIISERTLLAPTTLFRYGLSRGFEIRMLSQWESLKNITNSTKVNGIDDLEIGAKVQLLKKDNINTEIAFLSHIILPTGTKELSNGKLGTINKLSVSHELNDSLGLGYNLGYDYFGYGKGILTYSLSLGIAITNLFGMYIESYGDLVEFKNPEANFDAGITYLINDNFQLDFSFGTGINHTMNYLSVGCSVNIAKETNI